MNDILTEMVNQLAPLVMQIIGILILAIVRAILMKARGIAEMQLNADQRSFLAELASTAVHLAETEGLGKAGSQKAAMAQSYVAYELAHLGVTSVSSADVASTIVGAVQRAWAREIGPRPPTPSAAVNIAAEAVTANPPQPAA